MSVRFGKCIFSQSDDSISEESYCEYWDYLEENRECQLEGYIERLLCDQDPRVDLYNRQADNKIRTHAEKKHQWFYKKILKQNLAVVKANKKQESRSHTRIIKQARDTKHPE